MLIRKLINMLVGPLFGSVYNTLGPSDHYSWVRIIRAWRDVIQANKHWRNVDQPRLKKLRDIHSNAERAFIICNGPSLNKLDLRKLRKEITFGVNAIYLNFQNMGFKPTYYVCEDNLPAEDRCAEISSLEGMTKLFPIRLAYCLERNEDTIFFNHCPDILPDNKKYYEYGFSKRADLATIGGNTVTYTCLQFAYFFGIRTVYLIGADHEYKIPVGYDHLAKNKNYVIHNASDDENHFHPDYFGKGYRWHNPKVNQMEDSYKRAKIVFESDGRKIYNATVGGRLDVFERVDYESLFLKSTDLLTV